MEVRISTMSFIVVQLMLFLPYRFPGKERDAESATTTSKRDTLHRQWGECFRRSARGSLANPQSLNKYAYALNNPLVNTDPTGLYVCKDSADCSSQQDKDFEAARQHDLQSKNADVVRGAPAYGDVNAKNGTTVGFADLGKSGEGGITTSHLGTDENGNLQAQTSVTLNSNDKAGSTALQSRCWA